jgi:hypothetical protein
MNPLNRAVMKQQAKENTTIQRGNKKKGFVNVKSGTPLDHAEKHSPSKLSGAQLSNSTEISGEKFGMSKGITKNMDNYESLRVDVWLSGIIQEGETEKEAFARVESIIDEVLEESVMATVEANQE